MSTWILLRGLTREARHWGSFPALFARQRESFAAGDGPGTLLELPGNGREHALRAPPGVPEMMMSVRSRAAALGLPAPYRLLAMSLGGMVGTAWAQRYPEEIEHLVLINTSMRPFCNMTQRLRPAAWSALAQLAGAWPHPETSERIIHALTCNRTDTANEDIAAWAEIRRTAPVSAANALRQLWAAARFRADRQAPRCPVLLLSSASDRLVDPACSARIAAQWKEAAHAIHPTAGHDLPHDDPAWTADAICKWLLAVEQGRQLESKLKTEA
ncbi:alpha/beta hydrolase [Oxalobacteraceae bacterium CAVE-383]|nr:alpha/beta hydrolase [Oxalobacteraceae bacterium CAVE-383]